MPKSIDRKAVLKAIISGLENNKTFTDLSRELGVSRGTITSLARRYQDKYPILKERFEKSNKFKTEGGDKVERIAQMMDSGMSFRDIAREIGISTTSVVNVFRRNIASNPIFKRINEERRLQMAIKKSKMYSPDLIDRLFEVVNQDGFDMAKCKASQLILNAAGIGEAKPQQIIIAINAEEYQNISCAPPPEGFGEIGDMEEMGS